MAAWLEAALAACDLTEEVSDYLLGRGVKESTIAGEGMKTWRNLTAPSPDPEFCKICRPLGERLEGMLVVPVRSPSGALLGFEARDIHKKRILDFRLPASKYTPFFIGTRKAMPAIWAGGDVWLAEGLFDLAALEWVAPARDAVLSTVRANITPQQLWFLARFCKGTVRVVFDRDITGRRATTGYVDEKTGKPRFGAIQLLHGVGLSAVDVRYEGGKDPGEIWDSGGVKALRARFAE